MIMSAISESILPLGARPELASAMTAILYPKYFLKKKKYFETLNIIMYSRTFC
jgi:hypothetical protein